MYSRIITRSMSRSAKLLPKPVPTKFLPVQTAVYNINNVPKINNNNYDLINGNEKLKKYMSDVYSFSGKGFTTTLITGALLPYIIMQMPMMIPYLVPLYIGNFGLSIYTLYKISNIPSLVGVVDYKNKHYEEFIPDNKKRLYYLFSVCNGITIAPLVTVASSVSPTIIPTAIVATLGIFGGASHFALKQNDLSIAKWQAPLLGGVVGLIGVSLVQLGAMYMGYPVLANNLDFISIGGSLVIFTGLIAADTQMALKNYYEQKLDSIYTSLELLLDATNIFIDLLKVLIKLKINNTNNN